RLVECIGHVGRAVDSATMLLQCGQAAIDIHANWVTPVKIREIHVTGSRAFMYVNLIAQKVTLTPQNPALSGNQPGTPVPSDQYLSSCSRPERREIEVAKAEPLKEELAAFLRCVREGVPVPVSGMDALRALQVAEQGRRWAERKAPPAQDR